MTKIRGNPQLDPRPFYLSGGEVGCLLLHGFTGAPPEVRLLGDYLNHRGVTVAGPLLAGHGVTPQELSRVHWQDWVASAEQGWGELRRTCGAVFVGGLSMGALVACHIAALHPEAAGLMVYSPAIRLASPWVGLAALLRGVVPQWPKGHQDDLTDPLARTRTWHYDTYPTAGIHQMNKLRAVVCRELDSINAPALVVHSTLDTTIHATAAQFLIDRLGSQSKDLVTLHHSGHNLTVDSERDAVFARTFAFMVAQAGGPDEFAALHT